MKTNSTSTDSNTTSSTPTPPTTSNTGYTTTPPAETPKETVDDFGYEVPPTDTPAPTETVTPPAPTETPKEDDKPVDEPATGYGDKTPPAEAPKDEPKDEPADDPTKVIAETLKELGDGYDKEKIIKFAVENKLTKEQVEAYVKLTKEETASFNQKQAEALKVQRESWVNELKTDTTFGGEHFDKNVDKVEKLLAKYMPETKKVLTERKGMLPPSLMKDLLKIANALNPVTTFVQGDANEPQEEKHFLDDLYS